MGLSIVHDLLAAEIETFVFANEAAFRRRTLRLERRHGLLEAPTAGLWRDLEIYLRPHTGALSLEALAQMRDGVWFFYAQTLTSRVELGDYLCRLARDYLQPDGDQVVLRTTYNDGFQHHTFQPREDLPQLAARWRWLSLRVPADLLVAAAFATERRPPPCDHVTLLTPQLRAVLSEPVADTHLHIGAATSFATLWTNLMGTLGDRGVHDDVGRLEQHALPFGSGHAFLRKLIAAAAARVVLARYLVRARVDSKARFTVEPEWAALFKCLCFIEDPPPPGVQDLITLYRGLRTPPRRPYSLRDLNTHAIGLTDWLREIDPLSEVFTGAALPETLFASEALRYLGRRTADDDPDEGFAHAFWQYQRVRNATFRVLTQEPGVGGLDWFSRSFERISKLMRGLQPLLLMMAVDHQSRSLRLASIEVRATPREDRTELHRFIRELAAQVRHLVVAGGVPPEIGLVLHFVKSPVDTVSRPPRMHADPHEGARFYRWSIKKMREARSIASLLTDYDDLMFVVRGVDIAGTELATPNWPVLPLLQMVRDASRAAATRHRPAAGYAPLRVTVHAGEDYRRLVEGLRRIHELIEFGALEIGDRIGHGLALGDLPERWAGARAVYQPAEERLDDLLWELDRYSRAELPASAARIEAVRSAVHRLSDQIYGEPVDAYTLIKARRLRHNVGFLRSVGYPDRLNPPGADEAADLAWRYLTAPEVYELGQAPIKVLLDDMEIAMLKAAQAWLRGQLTQLEITVESNPSSNLLIGAFANLDEHPALRMQPLPGRPLPEGGAVLLSLNADDPLSFASSLADEYAHMYYALLRQGVSAQDALGWLDQLRINGLRSKFTHPRGANDPIVYRRIATWNMLGLDDDEPGSD